MTEVERKAGYFALAIRDTLLKQAQETSLAAEIRAKISEDLIPAGM
jgi:hypothetical protein